MNYKNSKNLNSYQIVRKSSDGSVEQTIIVLDADNSAFISEGDLNQMIADTNDIKAIFNSAK